MRYNMSEIMKRAWNLFKSNANIKSLSEGLKKAWAEAKGAVSSLIRYRVKEWFYNKNEDSFTTDHCVAYPTFYNDEIVKETEKALCIKFDLFTKGGAETKYTKNIWVPKSCVEAF